MSSPDCPLVFAGPLIDINGMELPRGVRKFLPLAPERAESGVRRNLKHKLPPPLARAPLSQGHLGPAAEQDALHALRRAGYDSERALATML